MSYRAIINTSNHAFAETLLFRDVDRPFLFSCVTLMTVFEKCKS